MISYDKSQTGFEIRRLRAFQIYVQTFWDLKNDEIRLKPCDELASL